MPGTEAASYPEIDPTTVAPCRKGYPDLLNHMPTRFVTYDEAKWRKWRYFFDGSACTHKHIAPRYVCNPALCIDCKRAARNKPLIGKLGLAGETRRENDVTKSLPPAPGKKFKWTAVKRVELIRAWCNTGSIALARDAIGVEPYEFSRERERNHEFAEALNLAEPEADRMLEERAIADALKGNDKLIVKILSAKDPRYRESLKVDLNQNVVGRLTDEQITAKLDMFLKKLRPAEQVTDVEFEEQKQIVSEVPDADS